MDKRTPFFIVGAIVAAIVMFVVTLFLLVIMWAWIIPDLFPGAVEQGLIASKISWLTALKVALFVGILSGFAKGIHIKKDNEPEPVE